VRAVPVHPWTGRRARAFCGLLHRGSRGKSPAWMLACARLWMPVSVQRSRAPQRRARWTAAAGPRVDIPAPRIRHGNDGVRLADLAATEKHADQNGARSGRSGAPALPARGHAWWKMLPDAERHGRLSGMWAGGFRRCAFSRPGGALALQKLPGARASLIDRSDHGSKLIGTRDAPRRHGVIRARPGR